jgi:mono/diheme cytochrome c family protein
MSHDLTNRLRLPVLGVILWTTGTSVAADKVQFNRDVRPILSENCFACHGPDSASRKASLRLDQRAAAVEAGAIAPGDLEDSELLARIGSHDAKQVMPPPATKKTLTTEQKATLKRWISEGAEYQPHWSLIAPKRPVPPAVKDASWPKGPMDRFMLAELERRGLKPAPGRWPVA